MGRKKNVGKLDIRTPESCFHVIGVKSSTNGLQVIGETDAINPLIRAFLHVTGLSESILSNPQQKEKNDELVGENNVLQNMRMTIERSRNRMTTKKQSLKKPIVPQKPP